MHAVTVFPLLSLRNAAAHWSPESRPEHLFHAVVWFCSNCREPSMPPICRRVIQELAFNIADATLCCKFWCHKIEARLGQALIGARPMRELGTVCECFTGQS